MHSTTTRKYGTAAKALGAVAGLIVVAQVSHTAAVALVLSAVFLGGLAVVARLTASPVAVSHTHHDTWFDQPDGELIVHGTPQAAPRR